MNKSGKRSAKGSRDALPEVSAAIGPVEPVSTETLGRHFACDAVAPPERFAGISGAALSRTLSCPKSTGQSKDLSASNTGRSRARSIQFRSLASSACWRAAR
jgi:hypothetical protein